MIATVHSGRRVGGAREGSEQDLLARIAHLYYKEGRSQQEIARELGVTRFKVMRLLKESKERGIVRIEIARPAGECLELEMGLRALGLDEAVVAAPADGPLGESAMSALAQAAAQYLQRRIAGDRVSIGVAWGRTIYETVKALRDLGSPYVPEVTVVQLMGGIANLAYKISPTSIASSLAEVYGGKCHFLHAPALVASPELCRKLREDPGVRQTLQLARSVDMAIVGIGLVNEQSSMAQAGLLSERDLSILRETGACGAIAGHFFDADGSECRCPLTDRTISISFAEFRSIPLRVAVAGGSAKVQAILAALRGRLISVLVTDRPTARQVLQAAHTAAVP